MKFVEEYLPPMIGAAAIILVIALSLPGCSDHTGRAARQDWRTIHQPAPTTPGGSDGHGN